MKKGKLFCFVAYCAVVVLVVDVLFGVVSKWYVVHHPLPGDYQAVDYMMKEADDEAIILGSSVALNSLMPTVVEDSLSVSCFNGGANGQGLPYFLTMVDNILRRYEPKMFILGFRPTELNGTGAGGRYNFLVPYYHSGSKVLDGYIEMKDAYEPYLLKSNLYRYNTIWWRILLYHFMTPGEPGEKGFVAKGIPPFFPTLVKRDGGGECTEERIKEFDSMMEICRQHNIKVVIYFPPEYRETDKMCSTELYVEKYCAERNIECHNYVRDPLFLQHKEWFYDNSHLNKDGAVVLSKLLMHDMLSYERAQ